MSMYRWWRSKCSNSGKHALMKPRPYRKSVVGVFVNAQGLLLVGERADHPGQWQFPQGGVEEGETYLQALQREMTEEVGVKDFSIEEQLTSALEYDFPAYIVSKMSKKYCGQQQRWFKLRLNDGVSIDPKNTDGEFVSFCWWEAEKVITRIVHWKRDVYCNGLIALGLWHA